MEANQLSSAAVAAERWQFQDFHMVADSEKWTPPGSVSCAHKCVFLKRRNFFVVFPFLSSLISVAKYPLCSGQLNLCSLYIQLKTSSSGSNYGFLQCLLT